jgi:hypothetical protein
MAEFHITNSSVEQITASGTNVKTGRSTEKAQETKPPTLPPPSGFEDARNRLQLYARRLLDELRAGRELSYELSVRVNEAAGGVNLPIPFPTPSERTGPNAKSVYLKWNDSVAGSAGCFRIVDHRGAFVPMSVDDRATIERLLENLLVEAQVLTRGPHRSAHRQFAVALSFPGEHRSYVQQIDTALTKELDPSRVFYDDRFKSEIARPNADGYLQGIYHDRSELVVVFLCAEYERKEWCGLEWRAIRDLIKKKQMDEVMFFRFDDTNVPGVYSIDGYIDARKHTPEEAAKFILQRHTSNKLSGGNPK